jgi:cobalt/nickel transport system permease protein
LHIPDGYLSPSTCAALYVLSGSGWYIALKKMKRQLTARVIPVVSVFAALSFVVMMFNLPLPGGTTAHAVGIAVAAIVLGPWGAILALSIALTIQALLFGDGGVTTLWANSFNMAIAGSLLQTVVYRLLAGRSAAATRRRVVAAGIAGYVSINVAALLAAVEFGIQPGLFHDANGTPLYAPYPLRVAIPAMMIGHLTIAGAAEAVLSAAMVAYLQKTSPSLVGFRLAAEEPVLPARSNRRLWLTAGLLMLLTPLGTLAVGSAWGEWSAESFERAPTGLQRLSSVWTAPFPSYAPTFIHNPFVGYLLSAMFGVGLFVVIAVVARAFTRREIRT